MLIVANKTFMLSVANKPFMLSVNMVNDVMLIVIMLSAVVPKDLYD